MGQSVQGAFNPRLESLRGLAAVAVLSTHCFGAFAVSGFKDYWVLPFLEQPASAKFLTIIGGMLNPSGAVVLFFVLSGYVLSLSLLRSSVPMAVGFAPYLLRRAFRLLPAMWVSILTIVAVRYFVVDRVPDALQSGFYGPVFNAPISGWAIAKNFSLIEFQENVVTWTMYIEAVGSLFLPLLVLISSKSRLAGLGLFFIILALARHSGNFDARRFLFCFQIGVLLACYPNLVRYVRFPAAFFVGGVALMVYQRVSMIDGGYGGKGTVLEAIASTMMIAAVLTPRSVATFKWLEWAPISFLGRISYSVYLFHLAALFIVAQVLAEIGISELGSPLSQLLLGIGTLALTVPVAWTSYALVEIPAIRWGRIFGNALAATLLVRGDHSSIDPMVERAKIGGDLLDSAR